MTAASFPHQFSSIHCLLEPLAKFRAWSHHGPQHISGGQVADAVLLSQPRGLEGDNRVNCFSSIESFCLCIGSSVCISPLHLFYALAFSVLYHLQYSAMFWCVRHHWSSLHCSFIKRNTFTKNKGVCRYGCQKRIVKRSWWIRLCWLRPE